MSPSAAPVTCRKTQTANHSSCLPGKPIANNDYFYFQTYFVYNDDERKATNPHILSAGNE